KELYGTSILVFHVYCDLNDIPDNNCCLILPMLLLAFLSACAGSYSGSTVGNYASAIHICHLLHGHPWRINKEKLKAIL
ncbi:hypothetical protein HYDPIDRAFT_50362, partial [Hydnomerulius pinastri MD-312]